MTNVIIVGANGRMGRLVAAEIAAATDLELVAVVTRESSVAAPEYAQIPVATDLVTVVARADVVIDFSTPEGTVHALAVGVDARKPFITGVTGLSPDVNRQLHEASRVIPVFVASNFSLGVSALQVLLPQLVRTLPDADIELTEMHHRHKRDAPSGTAISLLAAIESARGSGSSRVFGREGESLRSHSEIGVHSLRGGGNPGEHTVILATSGEEIRITHRALNRSCFAQGAIAACRWVVGRSPGHYGMVDLTH